MAFTPVWGCGFEVGHKQVIPAADQTAGDISVTTLSKKTGSYSLVSPGWSANHYWRVPVALASEYYVGLWIYNYGNGGDLKGSLRLEACLDDGKLIDVRWNVATCCYDAYVDGNLRESGTVPVDKTQWHHLQVHFLIDDAGNIDTIVDGTLDVTYGGDTKPSATTNIQYIRFREVTNFENQFLDDIVIGTGGYPGDLRADPLYPNADTATEDWTRSAGADTWDLIEEVPPSDATYISSGTDAQQSIVGLTDWTGTGKVPKFVVAWVRGWKTDAVADQVKIIDQEGVDTNVGPAMDLLTGTSYVSKLLLNAPDGTVWDDTHVDALELGVESVIV
jgi:hypothetical protein